MHFSFEDTAPDIVGKERIDHFGYALIALINLTGLVLIFRILKS
ncbi:hypothetical protein J2755_000511 [Methanohalophilus levihalophilus]|nr:hypothetical protein [Methanohalophilus levihalophilus]